MTLFRCFQEFCSSSLGGMMRASGRAILAIVCGVAAGVTLLAIPAHADGTPTSARHVKTYTMRNLGTLGGLVSIPLGISGDTVVGYSSLPSGAYHAAAFNLKAGTVTDLGTLGGTNSHADAISGDIAVGSSQTTGDTATHAAAFNLDTGAIIDLGTLGGDHSGASAISGDIAVGSSQTTGDTETHAAAFNVDTGEITDLSATNESNSVATAVAGYTVVGNSFDGFGDVIPFSYDLRTGVRTDLEPGGGEVFAADGHVAVGDSGGQAVAYDLRSGKVTGLGQLTPSGVSTATAVSGHIAAGYAVTNLPTGPNGIPNHAVAYNLNTATIIDLGTLGGSDSTDSIAQAVSGHTVVGVSGTPTTEHAFAYNLNTGVMTDLGSLGGADTGSSATLITPDGLIIGWSAANDGGQYAVTWTP
jgi:probable HAF family extracellular repeat protein